MRRILAARVMRGRGASNRRICQLFEKYVHILISKAAALVDSSCLGEVSLLFVFLNCF